MQRLGKYLGVLMTSAALGARLLSTGRWWGAFVLVAGPLSVIVDRHAAVTVYRCEHCGNTFKVSVFTDFVSPHVPWSKYLRCPACNRRGWMPADKYRSAATSGSPR